MPATVTSIAGDQRVLALLDDKPKTTSEITDTLRREVWETWAEQEGLAIDWDEYGMPSQPLFRLLAWSTANQRGLVWLNPQQVYARLIKFERQGFAQRIQVPGRKHILWLAREAV